jgi:hypothetical protein
MDRIHYQWGFDNMSLKNLKEKVKTVGKRILHPEKIIEMTNWLHHLEFLVIKVMIFAISIHHLYVYTIKTIF